MPEARTQRMVRGMCLFLTLLLLGPRAVILLYWIGWPARWELAFDTFIVPFIGFLVAPWTTLMYVAVAPGGVEGADFLLLGMTVFLDLLSLGGGGRYGRQRAGGFGGRPAPSAWS